MKKEAEQDIDIVEGLRVAKGDRLIEIIGIWGFRFQYTALQKDYNRVADYASKVVPELVRLLTNPDADLGLRGTIAETLVCFGLTLDDVLYKTGERPNNLRVLEGLREETMKAIDLCLDYPISIWGKIAIVESLPKFTETESIRKLKEKIQR
jgi:hypothetical protein